MKFVDDKADLFTGALYNNYQAPSGFCFDILCADQPIIDGKHSPDNNVKERIDSFFEFVTKMAKGYRTPNLLITMGEDFHYQNADMWYKNLDKLIKYANERQANGSNINLLYSTPSCYLKSLHDAGISWPTKSDDFFPYASDPHSYWTGYFTSRPTLKRFERDGNHFLQTCKQLSALAPKRSAEFDPHLNFMRETMGIMQHHDAVTGTEKQKVALDYAKRMSVALRACSTNIRSVLNQLSISSDKVSPQPTKFEFKTCTLLNISSCATSELNNRFALTLYNPLAQSTNEYNIKLTFDTNGFLAYATADGMTRTISQEFLYYIAATGNNAEFLNRSSGAYIFRPDKNQIRLATDKVSIEVYKGPLVQEVHQQFNSWISQVVRVYKQSNHAEFEWLVGPIPIEDNIGKEVISRFTSDIKSDGIFYTDSNGREMLKRRRNHRETWNVKIHESVAGNYYPVTTKIALEDDIARMAILTDRAQGGSSLEDGVLELMVHRRLLHDDAFGVGEALNETEYGEGLVARGKHHLFVGKSLQRPEVSLKAIERLVQLETLLPSWKFFSNVSYSSDQWLTSFTNTYSGISAALPKYVHLLSLEPWHEKELLVRFEHILEKKDGTRYSQYVQFNIKDVLGSLNIENIRETTLDGNAWLDEHRRMEFVPDPEDEAYNNYGTFRKSSKAVHLLSAAKPMLEARYSKETLEAGQLGAESNRIKRSANSQHFTMHRKRPQVSGSDNLNKSMPSSERDKYLIELSPMEIRTFIVYLQK
ncbi:hypothetical protein AWZ03_006296 [Drosophila navojoa]|uniref:alpha-mannosidase n=1 Tax=Drosophila navojoa TaxID=7232 RepID=A0A484BEV0_DRONA|nr:hypothetical protein AWZ03_006296 [Drosophila navojoa]